MKKAKRKMLEKKGWKAGTAEEFLELSPAESRCIELKLASSKTGQTPTYPLEHLHERLPSQSRYGWGFPDGIRFE